ncbi:MAG: GNAT family protein [Acidiphilium sp.]|nr:GNAT family protein [Acidiphilium sp.]MDD4935896.1 GNAT family protein [Acidiphilium sp.]
MRHDRNKHDRNKYGQPVGTAVPGWVPCDVPSSAPMEGTYCRLERLDPARHADDLIAGFMAAPDDRDWTWWRTARPTDEAAFYADIARMAARAGFIAYAIVDRATGRALGHAAYMGIEPEHGTIEVGAVNYTPALRRSRAGTEAMFLMMHRAFDELGYRRYEWQCHSLNAPSRRAAERFGFRLEGVFRQKLVTQGRNRDTAWYSILDGEWPPVKAAFLAWLDPGNFSPSGDQRSKLSQFRA